VYLIHHREYSWDLKWLSNWIFPEHAISPSKYCNTAIWMDLNNNTEAEKFRVNETSLTFKLIS
jgi:hypothetical protein